MQSPSPDRNAAIDRGVAYLLKQQGADGGWHSLTYGQLKGGAAVTTLVIDSLSQLPAGKVIEPQLPIERGIVFLKDGWTKRKTIAAPDGSLDFPTYGCALLVTAIARLQTKLRIFVKRPNSKIDFATEQRALFRNYLFGAQVLEARGFEPDHPSYGGWDFLGAGDAMGITTGTNVSVVVHVLEALADDKSAAADKARAAATGWLTRCQQADGGFAFTPEPMSLNNKAEFSDEARLKPRSYGTATCDGVRALLAAGKNADDAAVKSGIAWLVKRPALEVVPGFEDLPAETDWRRGLRYYYYQSLARVLPLMPAAERLSRHSDLERILLKDQLADGRWQNESDRMRENDPLIATCFAVSALASLS